MVWENQDPDAKNLESLRQGLSLENIMDSIVITDSDEIAALGDDLGNGQFRLVYTGGTLYLYTKYEGDLYRMSWTLA